MLTYLRAHGAMLAAAKPEFLLPVDDYLKLTASTGSLTRKERAAVKREHGVRHPETWLEVLFQVIRTHYASRLRRCFDVYVRGRENVGDQCICSRSHHSARVSCLTRHGQRSI